MIEQHGSLLYAHETYLISLVLIYFCKSEPIFDRILGSVQSRRIKDALAGHSGRRALSNYNK